MNATKRAARLKVINLLMAIDLLIIATTAAFSSVIIPLGFYRPVHAIPGVIFLMLLTSHLILNKGWIKSTYFKKR